ncbi:hypothetical protein Hanom_Chr09g00787871 [Helianthus anomalus]
MWNSSSQKKPKGVEKTVNLNLKTEQTNKLPDDIDVTYTKSYNECESELVKEVVEKVLENESDNTDYESTNSKFSKENSSSQPESDESFDKNYIPKSASSLSDDPNVVVYKMNGSDKLYSDDQFPIQNVNLNKVEASFQISGGQNF